MYKRMTKSIEASMEIGNWFASGYRTVEDYTRLNRIKIIKNFVSAWKKSTNRLLKTLENEAQKKGAE